MPFPKRLRQDRAERVASAILAKYDKRPFERLGEAEQQFYLAWAEVAVREDCLKKYGLRRSDLWPVVRMAL